MSRTMTNRLRDEYEPERNHISWDDEIRLTKRAKQYTNNFDPYSNDDNYEDDEDWQ